MPESEHDNIDQANDSQTYSGSIGRTLSIWFLIISLVPLALLSVIEYRQANEGLVTLAAKEIKAKSDDALIYINDWFEYRVYDLTLQAKTRRNAVLLEILANKLKKSGLTVEEYVGSPDWEKAVYPLDFNLRKLIEIYPYIYDIFLIDTEGNILYTVIAEDDLGTNLFIGPYSNTRFSSSVQQALKKQRVTFSDYERYAPSANIVASFVNSPVYDEQDVLIGVLSFQLRSDQLSAYLNNDELGIINQYLVGADGLLRTALLNEEEVLVKQIITDPAQELVNEGLDNKRFETDSIGYSRYIGPTGEAVIGRYDRIEVLGVQWLLVTEIDEDVALSVSVKLRDSLLLYLSLISLVAIAVALYQSRRIAKPIKELSTIIEDITKGNTDQEIEITANNEIGALADSFKTMLQVRAQYEKQLEMQTKAVKVSSFALEEKTKQLELIIGSIQVGTWDWLVQTPTLMVNERWAEIVGYTLEELQPFTIERWVELVHPDDLEVSNKGLEDHWEHRTDFYQVEVRMRHKQGHWVWILSMGKVMEWDQDHKPVRMLGTHLDITESREARIQLEESRQQLQLIIDNIEVGTWDWNMETGYITINDRWASQLGFSVDEVTPLTIDNWPNFIHQEDLIGVEDRLERHFSGKDPIYEAELRYRHKDGHWVWILTMGRVIARNDKGEPIRMLGTHSDISKSKQQQLELLEARDKAEMAAVAKSEFLANMSHEIRTPMNGVIGMLSLLQRDQLTEKQRHYTELANSSAESLLDLINDILDFSKIESGKMELDAIDFDLRGQLGHFMESFAYRAHEKNIELILDVSGIDQSMVKGDPGRIRQILNNLIGNALKFTDQGEVVVKASLEPIAEGSFLFTCQVKDTGIGIRSEKIDRLFESFSQEDTSTTRKYGGTGLGLSIAKLLCELMGGEISVVSEPGVGSEFTFTAKLGASEESVQVRPTVDLKGRRILIVDDNATNREVLAGQLSLWEADVTEADSAAQALSIISSHQEQPFEIAFLDMQMPEVDGLELARQIRSDKSCDDMKMIMMTSLSEAGDRDFFAEAGFSAYFSKPATTSDIFDALMVLLEGGEVLLKAKPLLTQHHLHSLKSPKVDNALRVLVVEDNLINQEVVLALLEDYGIHADVANNGLEALQMLEASGAEDYDIILMDCQMPQMDGYKATRAIRQSQILSNPNVVIIAMTANAMQGDREKCLQAGMNDYMAKPIEPDLLDEKLTAWSDRAVARKAPVIDATKSPSQHKADHDVWDVSAFLGRVRNRVDRAEKLVALFLEETPEIVTALVDAVGQSNIAEIKSQAHKLKGSTALIGGLKVNALAQQIEAEVEQGTVKNLPMLIRDLQREFDDLLREVAMRDFSELSD